MAQRTLVVLTAAALVWGGAAAMAETAAGDRAVELVQAQQSMGQGGRGMGQGGGMGPGGGGMRQGQMFQQLDQDDDGFLTREEFVEGERPGRRSNMPAAEQRRARMFDQLDQDDDGRLSLREMPQPRAGAAH